MCAQEGHVARCRSPVSASRLSATARPNRSCWCHSEKILQSPAYGFKDVDPSKSAIDWPTIKSKRDAYIERLNGIYERSTSVCLHNLPFFRPPKSVRN